MEVFYHKVFWGITASLVLLSSSLVWADEVNKVPVWSKNLSALLGRVFQHTIRTDHSLPRVLLKV
jgi:hypothetical protein